MNSLLKMLKHKISYKDMIFGSCYDSIEEVEIANDNGYRWMIEKLANTNEIKEWKSILLGGESTNIIIENKVLETIDIVQVNNKKYAKISGSYSEEYCKIIGE